jgi:hypothetical protein
MKVAILISGQPRNFKKGYEELKRAYLDRYDCDVYLHSWKDTKFQATQFFQDRPVQEYTMENSWVDEVINLYQPKISTFEPPKIFDEKNIVDPMWRQPLQNTKAMWYSVQKAFEITPPGYDVYIRTRFDLRYEESLLNLSSLDLSTLHVWDWNTDGRVKHRGYYDVFAVGTYDTIGIYSNVFSRIDWYLNYDEDYKVFLQGGWPGQDSGLRNEYLLRWHLTTSGIPVTLHSTTIPHADGQIIR